MNFDLIIKNGAIVTEEKTYVSDLGITDGKIKVIDNLSAADANRVIDAKDKYVLPGIVEGHMHVEAPMGGVISADDFYTQSITAAFGGVTTFMDFTNTNRGDSLMNTLEERKNQMSKSAIDYAIHGRIVEATDSILNEIKEFKDAGCPSFKMYTTYKEDGFMIEEQDILKVFREAEKAGVLTMMHCESDTLCRYYEEMEDSNKNKSWKAHSLTRPVICEVDSAYRVMNFAKAVGNALLIVHTTTGQILDMAQKVQNSGAPVYIETCPHYLTIFDDIYDCKDGHLAMCSPPLRTKNEAEELWKGIKDDVISIIGSDDCSFTRKAKESRLDRDADGEIIQDYKKVVSGASGIEARLPLLLSEGVNKGRITINQFVQLTSTNPSKLYGMYPRKGCIKKESDADLIIIDIEKEHIINGESLHNNVGYTMFEGFKCKGKLETTVSGGQIIVEENEFLGEKNAGKFIYRNIDIAITEHFFGGRK